MLGMRTLKYVSFSIVLVLAIAATGFLVWANSPLAPLPEALKAQQSNSQVQVTEKGWIVFQPADSRVDTGLILYPGGRVDPRAYSPVARAIAEQGYLVAIVPMPLNLAVFGSDRAQDVIAAYPQIKHWAVGGHSLGGAMAAHFVYQHPGVIQGLVLWAAYPASGDDLSGQSLKVVSMIGSQDGLGTAKGVSATRSLLPQNTHFVVIEGGNHAQFGWYGDQPGDNPATISRADQQAQVIAATLELLGNIR